MARLIDADALIQNRGNDVTNWDNPYAVKISSIEHAPTVDAVEVVRCDVCKNAEPYDCTIHGTVHHLYKCKKGEGAIGYNKVVSSNDFCSCGKRKDGDGNE